MSDQNNNQKYSDLGDQIKDSVKNAIDTGNFSGLSDSVSRSLSVVLGDVGNAVNKAITQSLQENQYNRVGLSNSQREAFERARAEARQQAERFHAEQERRIQLNKQKRANVVKQPLNRIKFKTIGSVSSPLFIAGGLMGLFAGIPFFWLMHVPGVNLLGIALALIGTGLLGVGIHKQKWLSTASKYRDLCKERMYCSIEEIMSATGQSRRKVLKTISKLLSRGYFEEGYIDEERTTFMVSKEVYNQYVNTKKEQARRAAEELQGQGVSVAENSGLSDVQLTELNNMIAFGQSSIKRLHELNDQIPGERITAKLYTTEGLLNDIFNRVKEEPEQMRNCRKLMDYHLPTVLKLVEAYAEYDKISVPGEDIISAKEEIEKTIDLINQAFAELLNRLFQESVWDVTSDAQVLKTMLAQEGLAKDIVVNEEV